MDASLTIRAQKGEGPTRGIARNKYAENVVRELKLQTVEIGKHIGSYIARRSGDPKRCHIDGVVCGESIRGVGDGVRV